MPYSTGTLLIAGVFVAGAASLAYFGSGFFPVTLHRFFANGGKGVLPDDINTQNAKDELAFIVTHIKTPEPLKGIYMMACVAGDAFIPRETREAH